jgi:2-phospho-L-lactate transferase/gluconeogenesis factor (CofD/UPF0052 family)
MHVSSALKIYVSNIATQMGETDFYSCYDHVRALEGHIGEDLFDVILCNNNYAGDIGEESQWVLADERTLSDSRTCDADLVDESHPRRHDSAKLAQQIIQIHAERTGRLL